MNIYCVGRKYHGKTTLAVFLARRIRAQKNGYKFVVFEPKWAAIRSLPSTENLEQFKEFYAHDEFPDADGLVYLPANAFSEDDAEQVRDDFSAFCEALDMDALLRNPPERPFIVVIDEAYYLQGRGYLHPWLGRMMRLATEKKLYIIQCAHRPVQLTPDIRGQADSFFWFFQSLPEDLEVIAELCDEETAEEVSRLPKHHVISYDVETRTREVWSDPGAWYTDLSKPYDDQEVSAIV